jgi:type VI secretion system lysozyme-like protein
MKRNYEDTDAAITVLDRLLQPARKSADVRASGSNDALESIARDLEVLLNTQRQEEKVPLEFEESAVSILNFGVPEFTSYDNLSSAIDQRKLCKAMEEAIQIFEPRLSRVSVRLAESKNNRLLLSFLLEATVDFLSERETFRLSFKRNSGETSVLSGGTA